MRVQGCEKKLVSGCEKRSAHLQPAQAGHARLMLNKAVTFICTTLYLDSGNRAEKENFSVWVVTGRRMYETRSRRGVC